MSAAPMSWAIRAPINQVSLCAIRQAPESIPNPTRPKMMIRRRPSMSASLPVAIGGCVLRIACPLSKTSRVLLNSIRNRRASPENPNSDNVEDQQ
jgi:hypothetical protein